MSRQPACALVLALLLIPAACQQLAAEQAKGEIRAAPEFISAAELEAAVSVEASEEAPALMAETLSDQGHYRYLVVRREETGEPEVHADWTDVAVVREGSGTLIYGGRVEGGEETDPGEMRGGRIVEGQERRLAAGDVAMLPAQMPHQVRLGDEESIVYTIVKIKEPDAAQ